MKFLNILALAFLTAACVGTDKVSDVFGIQNGEDTSIPGGCVSAEAIDQTRIRVTYNFPSQATMGKIIANGVEVASIPNPGSGLGSITIPNLLEGLQYTFRCSATLNGVDREGVLTAQAQVVNRLAPDFDGLESTVLGIPGYVTLSWQEPGTAGAGVAALAAYYKVRTFLGPQIDPALEILPHHEVLLGQNAFTVGQIGDEIELTFHVSACTINHICDANSITNTVTIPKYMAPINTGAISATGVLGSTVNGKSSVEIGVNWDHTPNYGGLTKRHLYVSENATHNNDLTNFTLYKTENIVTYDPGHSILFSAAEEGKEYFFIVRGEDGSGQIHPNNEVVSIVVPDLTPAQFSGLNALALGTNKEKDIVVIFNSIIHNPNDVVNYKLYYTSVPFGSATAPADSCTNTSAQVKDYSTQLVASNTQNVQITFNEAQPRRNYNMCLKTIDFSGNISKTEVNGTITTIDTTAPTFAGAQSDTLIFYDGNTATPNTLKVSFPKSLSTDVNLYRLDFSIKNLETNALSSISKSITKDLFLQKCNASSCTINYNLIDGVFGENQEVKVVINACDDGIILPQGQENCSLLTQPSNAVQTGDMTGPQFFASTLSLSSPLEGKIDFSWVNPQASSIDGLYSPSQLAYFKIYLVDVDTDNYTGLLALNSATSVFRVDCANGICPNNHSLINFEAYSKPYFTIIAFDQTGNPSPSFEVSQVAKQIVVKDTTAPNFTGTTLTYNAATFKVFAPIAYDNQMTSGSQIHYQVYYKKDSDFSDTELQNPSTAPLVITSGDFTYSSYQQNTVPNLNLSFDLPISSMSQGNYFYTICAFDESNNNRCINRSAQLTIVDLVAPSIKLAEARSSLNYSKIRTDEEKKWVIQLQFEDTSTPMNQLIINVYQKFSAAETDIATKNDPNIMASFGSLDDTGKVTSSVLSALPNKHNWFAHYMVQVFDGYNTVEKTFSLKFSTQVAIAEFRPRTLKSGVSNTVAIKGSGFSYSGIHGVSSTVTIGGSNCSSLDYVSENYLLCTITPSSSGSVSVSVQDSTNSEALRNITVDNNDTCVESGSGLITSPFIICSATQFMSLLTNVTNGFQGTNKYFRLGANLNFSGINYLNPNSIKGTTISDIEAAGLVPNFDGGGYFLSNISIGNLGNTALPVGLFSQVSTGSVKISNLNVYNMLNKLNTGNTYIGGILGSANAQGGKTYFENIGMYKKASDNTSQFIGGESNLGGLIGYSTTPVLFKDITLNLDFSVNSTITRQIGGLAGLVVLGKASNIHVQTSLTSSAGTSFTAAAGIIGQVSSFNCSSTPCQFSNLSSDYTLTTNGGYSLASLFGRVSANQSFVIQDSSVKFNLNQTSANSLVNGAGGLIGRLIANAKITGQIFRSQLHSSTLNVNKGNLTTPSYGVGGLVGTFDNNHAALLSVESSRTINSTIVYTGKQGIGGLIGQIVSTSSVLPVAPGKVLEILDSYTQMTVTGYSSTSPSNIGGLVGGINLPYSAENGANDLEISRSYTYNCYAGDVSAAGGLVATDNSMVGMKTSIVNSYYNSNHAIAGCNGLVTSYDDLGTKYSKNALNTQATFEGFSFSTIWKMNALGMGPEFK